VLDHLAIRVRDFARSKAFYVQALAPLGASVQMEFPEGCGLGPPGKPGLWIGPGEPSTPVHLAFSAPDRGAVDAFYKAAIDAGGQDNGPPGVREHYHPTYYAAFVIDPDGHNVEAVCHAALGAARKPSRKRAASKRSPSRSAARRSGRGATRSTRKPSRKKATRRR
jgi:catechol 2,3-dioxygenase-like lactoylglutathione lyase family enzyme